MGGWLVSVSLSSTDCHRWAPVAGPSHESGDAKYNMILVYLSHKIEVAFSRWREACVCYRDLTDLTFTEGTR